MDFSSKTAEKRSAQGVTRDPEQISLACRVTQIPFFLLSELLAIRIAENPPIFVGLVQQDGGQSVDEW